MEDTLPHGVFAVANQTHGGSIPSNSLQKISLRGRHLTWSKALESAGGLSGWNAGLLVRQGGMGRSFFFV